LFGSFEGPQALGLEPNIFAAPFALMDIHGTHKTHMDAEGRRRMLGVRVPDVGRLIRNPVYVARSIPLPRRS
jgi:hypothetical protein